MKIRQPTTTLAPDPHHLERVRINFSWILKLRWAAAAGQLSAILLVNIWLGIALPLHALFTLIAFECFSNIVLTGWFKGITGPARAGGGSPSAIHVERVLGSVMLLDIFLLSLLLFITGGPTNPFCVFFVVNIVLSAVVLNATWTWTLGGVALLCLGGLILHHLPVAELETMGYLDSGGRETSLSGRLSFHLKGLAVAFVTALTVITLFITRLTKELTELETALGAARQEKARFAHLEALGTLAAGAAHELASPLSTIAVAAKDLEIALAKEDPAGESAEDARLIRQEVTRCRNILDLMASDAGQTTGEPLVATSFDELLDATLSDLKGRDHVELRIDRSNCQEPLIIPRRALSLALRQIVKNALDASAGRSPVRVEVSRQEASLLITVQDRGAGMSREAAARATEPFFTTKEPGSGMGLGLFLSQTVVARLDGQIEFETEQNQGTTVRVTLPWERLQTRTGEA